jgi:hypothetical protein
MRALWAEVRRELRWAWSSRVILLVAGAAVLFSAWSAVGNIGNASAAAEQYRTTADGYASAGFSVEDALAAPVTVTPGANGGTTIDNPVRYDYDAAIRAAAVLSPVGGAGAILSLAGFVFEPVLLFAVGLVVATHDVRSGSIAMRWPQVRRLRVLLPAKVAALVVISVGFVAALLASASLAGAASVAGAGTFRVAEGMPVSLVELVGVACGIGALAALLGFAAGSVTRERGFTLVAVALVYFLLPLGGNLDPRNIIAAAGAPWYVFVGGFQPKAIEPLGVAGAVGYGAILALLSLVVSVVVWRMRERLPADLS